MNWNLSSERRRLTPRPAVLLLALIATFALLLSGDGGVAQAQSTAGALVSNLGQPSTAGDRLGEGYDVAQSFTTGTNPDGYTLTSIDLRFRTSSDTDTPTVTLHTGSETGTKVADFTGPSALTANTAENYTFTPTTTVTLNASTEYWVLVEGGSVNTQWHSTSSVAEDSGHAAGWSISNNHSRRTGSSSGAFASRDKAQALNVNGAINPIPPRSLVSNVGQDLGEDPINLVTDDAAQAFTTGSNSTGYWLTGVDLLLSSTVTPAGSSGPTVTLHSGSATGPTVAALSGDGVISATGNYAFTAASRVPLTPSTTYWVVAEDGGGGLVWPYTGSSSEDSSSAVGWSIADHGATRTATSAGAFTEFPGAVNFMIRVNGLPRPSPATGTPSITAPNVFRVPAVLGVDLSGITDGNGVTNIAGSATYQWQRFAADGTTLEADTVGTGDTYRLTDRDAGKTLKVSVEFTDDDGYAEGPLTSDATDAVTAAATCAAPTLTGGAAFLGGPRKVTIGSTEFAYGFSPPAGDLDDSGFTTAVGNRNRILSIVNSLNLTVELFAGLSANEKRTLVLHVCGDKALRFSSSFRISSTGIYIFSNTGVDWSGHAERIIYLSQDTAVPTFVSATVNGTSLVMTFSEELGAAASLANGAFTVKKGSGGTEQTLSGSPSISGSTVTLTLATAVSATDTGVKVLYTKPETGTANKIVDTFGNETATFPADQDVGNLLADSTPPELAATDAAVLAADGLTLTLTYNEALKESSVPAAFTVKATPAGGSEAEVALASSGGVTVSGSTVVLTLATPIAHNDGSVKVRYDKPAMGAVIEDATGNDAASFPDRAVPNNSTAPRVSIEAVYDDASSLIANPVFRVRRSNTGSTNLIVNVSRSQTANYVQSIDSTILIQSGQTEKEFTVYLDYPGNTNGDLTFTVEGGSGYAPAIAPNNAATVEVKAPASGLPVTVRQAQTSWTVEEGGTVDVAVTFTLAPGLAEPRDSFTVYLDPSDELAERGDDYVAYTDPEPRARAESGGWQPVSGGGKTQTATFAFESIQDTDVEANEVVLLQLSSQGIDAADFPVSPADRTTTISILDDDPLVVTDVEVTSTSTNSYYGVGDMIEFTVTFTAPVTAEATTQFAFQLGGATRQAARTGDEEEGTAAQTFEYTVASTDPDDGDGISWGANALRLNGGSITFDAKEALIPRNADLAHDAQGALPGQKVDTTKPSLEEAEVDEATLSLFFSEELNTTAPANTDFTVSVDGGTGANPTAVSISGSVVTLTLAAAVTQDQTATVSYAKPSTNPIKDLSGKEADAFTDRNVDPASDIANLLAAPGNRRVTLTWDNPNDNTIQRYQYRYKNTSDSGWNPDWRNISGSNANTTSFTATGLTNGIEYTFQVRPVFLQSGMITMGKEGEVKSAPRGPLAAPRNLAATSAGDGEIALSWDDPSDITITGYQYRYRDPSDSDWNPDWTDIDGSGATTASHTLNGLTNNLLYTLEVRALRDATEGPSARTTQKPRGPLAAPANFSAASGEDRQATLSWDNSGDDSITRYQYRYRISSVNAWNPDWTDIPGSRWNTTSYSVRSLVNQTGYTFEVRALRDALEGPSSSDTATPEGPPSVPLPPRSLKAHPADRSLGLSWDVPAEEDSRAPVTGYRVRYREAGRSWRTVSRSDGLLRWQTVSGLRNGTTYEVQVASVNSVGVGAWTGVRGAPQAPRVDEPPPEPAGEEPFNVGTLNVWWTGVDPEGNQWGNLREMDSCAGTFSFTVIWSGPGRDRNAAEWAAHIALSGEASGVTYSFRRSDTQGDYYEMNGRVRLDGRGWLSIRVRGRYGATWGEWSPKSGLYCFENQ